MVGTTPPPDIPEESPTPPIIVDEIDCDWVEVGEGDRVAESSFVAGAVKYSIVEVTDAKPILLLLGVTVPTTNLVGDRLGVFVALGDMEGEAPFERDDVGDAVTVRLLDAVLEKETVGDKLELTVTEADGVVVGVHEEEGVIDIVTLSV